MRKQTLKDYFIPGFVIWVLRAINLVAPTYMWLKHFIGKCFRIYRDEKHMHTTIQCIKCKRFSAATTAAASRNKQIPSESQRPPWTPPRCRLLPPFQGPASAEFCAWCLCSCLNQRVSSQAALRCAALPAFTLWQWWCRRGISKACYVMSVP